VEILQILCQLHRLSLLVTASLTILSVFQLSNSQAGGQFTPTFLSSQTDFQLNPEFKSSQSQCYVTTNGQSASLSWCQAPIWGLIPDFYICQTAGLLMWGALSDERMDLLFTIPAGPCQRSHSRGPAELMIIFYCLLGNDHIGNTALPLLPESSPWERVCPRRRHPATAAYNRLLKICFLAANVVSLSVSKSLPSNASTHYSIYIRCPHFSFHYLHHICHFVPRDCFHGTPFCSLRSPCLFLDNAQNSDTNKSTWLLLYTILMRFAFGFIVVML
jgi:hypothetical protein